MISGQGLKAHERSAPSMEYTPPEKSRQTVAFFDLDRTITAQGTFTPFIFFVAKRKPKAFLRLPEVLATALLYGLGAVGRDRLKGVMLKAVLSGENRETVHDLAGAFAEEWIGSRLRPGALEAIRAHRSAGHHLVMITASFDFCAGQFGEKLNFDSVISTKAQWDAHGRLMGDIDGKNCYGEEKLRAIERAMPGVKDRYFIHAYSDHYSDLPLLKWADRASAVNPDARLAKFAKEMRFEVMDWGRP